MLLIRIGTVLFFLSFFLSFFQEQLSLRQIFNTTEVYDVK